MKIYKIEGLKQWKSLAQISQNLEIKITEIFCYAPVCNVNKSSFHIRIDPFMK